MCMTVSAEKFANALLRKCDIYFGNSLISKEAIIEEYLSFFANSLISKERTVNFAFHTGSVCFDVVSVVAVALGCLVYNLSTNEDIISALKIDDMVMYNGKRYRWKGICYELGQPELIVEQDGKGKNGKIIRHLPKEKYQHLIKPYYGESQITDGRGIRNKKNNRDDFLSFVFDMDKREIPTQINISIVIVANRIFFSEISRQVRIVYDESKEVSLLDIIPATYYTRNGEEYQFGLNPTKTEAVLKVVGNISTARDLVLDENGNKIIGLLVMGNVSMIDSKFELADLLRRKILRFAFVTSPIKTEIVEHILKMYEDAFVFACTKSVLSNNNQMLRYKNQFTTELHQQILSVLHNTVTVIHVNNGWSWSEYRAIKKAIFDINQSNWYDYAKCDFVWTALSLLNLLNTAVFRLEIMEYAICNGHINKAIASPNECIQKLWSLADQAKEMEDLCISVADALEQQYRKHLKNCPKANAIKEYFDVHKHRNVAIIVPKEYYVNLLRTELPEVFIDKNITCIPLSRFDNQKNYDVILCVGQLNNRHFDPLQCFAAQNIDVLLYECEEKIFTSRQKKIEKYEQKLNQRIGAINMEIESMGDVSSSEILLEKEIEQFSALDKNIEVFNRFDINKLSIKNDADGVYAPMSEVKYVGTFVSGEQIFFSKYYSAVVFDNITKKVIEKKTEQLLPGDVLVFVKRDDYTKNIVDIIYERLLHDNLLGQGSIDIYEKSLYWKEALRKYKNNNDFTYRKVAEKINSVEGTLQEVTVRQWLVEDSHIVGPREEHTMKRIAIATQDPYLMADPQGYFDACGIVRRERRKILELISKAINDKLSGKRPKEGSVLSIVYDNVDILSENLELKYIMELEESVNFSVNLVNTPITKAEVLL